MKQRSALSKVFSWCCFFPSPCLLLHRSTFPSSPSLFICRVLCCLSPAVDSLSLYVVRLFYFAASSCGSLTVHASQPMPPCGMDAGKVGGGGNRPCLTLIWHWYTGMIKFAGQRCCRLQSDLCLHKNRLSCDGMKCLLPLCFSQSWITRTLLQIICHQGRVNKADLKVNIWWIGSLISVIDIPCFAWMQCLIHKAS